MNLPKTSARILFLMLLLMLSGPGRQVLAQASADASPQTSQADKQDDETNLDTQLYLLVATNQDVDDAKMPASLESVIRRLRASLPFKNYRLTATLLNRVKNDGRLNLRWVGGPMMASAAASNGTPSFNEFRVNTVKLVQDAGGQQLVRMDGFAFGTRIPIQTGPALASNGAAVPVINYESTGLNTDISMREGEAVVVGTLNVGPSGDAIILVMSVRKAAK
jgi:hypothetical protein